MKCKREIKIILELNKAEAQWLRKASKLPLVENECAADYEIRMRFFKAVDVDVYRRGENSNG